MRAPNFTAERVELLDDLRRALASGRLSPRGRERTKAAITLLEHELAGERARAMEAATR